MNEKLLGTWRQINHKALIDGTLCDIKPEHEVTWIFTESGFLTKCSGGEITAVHLVTDYLTEDLIIIRQNCTNLRTLYSVKFHDEGNGMTLTAFRKSSDKIQLVRS